MASGLYSGTWTAVAHGSAEDFEGAWPALVEERREAQLAFAHSQLIVRSSTASGVPSIRLISCSEEPEETWSSRGAAVTLVVTDAAGLSDRADERLVPRLGDLDEDWATHFRR